MFTPHMAHRHTQLATDSKKQHDWAEVANYVLRHGGHEKQAIEAANTTVRDMQSDGTVPDGKAT